MVCKRKECFWTTVFVLCTLIWILGSKMVFSEDFYIARNGNDNNPGTLSLPWKTIGKANLALKPGDTVYIREGIYSETISPRASGLGNAGITYRNYQTEKVVITDVSLGIELVNLSYITIKGLIFDGETVKAPKIKEWAHIVENSNSNTIQDCEMRFSEGWHGIKIGRGCQYNKILNNIMSFCGKPEPPAPDDLGNCITILGDYNLIEGNNVSYGGHNLFEIRYGKYNILRYNNFHNHWGRCGGLQVDDSGDDPGSRYNLVERNKIIFSTHYHDNVEPNPGLQCCQSHAIIRFNEFYNNFGHGLIIYCIRPTEGSFTKVYHNVFYHNGYNDREIDKEGLYLADWTEGKFPGEFRQVSIKNNIFCENKKLGIGYDGSSEYHIVEGNLELSDPHFLDKSDYKFQLLNNSPCLETGIFLTKTTALGSGSKIPVEDAGYFCDGFGLVAGDVIKLERCSQTAKIMHIDYGSNVITIDELLTWECGQGVSLAFQGKSPDIGAYEYVPEKKKVKAKK